MLKTHFLCSENIGHLLQTPCGRGSGAHTCLAPFRRVGVEEARAAEACLPGVLVQKSDILIINVDLDTDKVPYEVFDRLRREYHIDVASISISATLGGNAYRAYVQMM